MPEYRPWGPLQWMLDHIPPTSWTFLGCIGTEERSLIVWEELTRLKWIGDCSFVLVQDPDSRHSNRTRDRIAENLNRYHGQGGDQSKVTKLELFCSHDAIVSEINQLMVNRPKSLVFDISVFPKRFFFPMMKRILRDADSFGVENVVATYTIPKSYPTEPLAENFSDEWTHLPLFGPSSTGTKTEQLIVAVGFQALGLHSYLKGAPGIELKLLVPFPAPPAAFTRSWNLLRQIEQGDSSERFTRFRAGARDASDTFDRLVSLRNSSNKAIALAPFGPKPMSLGMCIFACLADAEVFYTQPSVYHPDYTIGVSTRKGLPEVYAYAIRLNGRNVYSL